MATKTKMKDESFLNQIWLLWDYAQNGRLDRAKELVCNLAAALDGDADTTAILEMDVEIERIEKALTRRTEAGQAKLAADWRAQREKGGWPWEN